VEIEKLILALEETIALLRRSRPSDWANMSLGEMISDLESVISNIRNSQPLDAELLTLLFLPTGVIQETSIDNGWGDDFLRISGIVDQFTTDR
jgi:hypothetical protein